MVQDKKIYRLNDNISFRQCTLFDGKRTFHGDCTCFNEKEENWKTFYECNQYGIHFHCTTHPAIELDIISDSFRDTLLRCPRCKKDIKIDSIHKLIESCLKMLNIEQLKDAQLIRIDDWYVPEIKDKIKTETDYWIKTEVKTDKDGDTMIVIYVGNKNNSNKSQFFVKPEKLQLTSDHKDLDPSSILSKIEVTLRDRKLSQKYD